MTEFKIFYSWQSEHPKTRFAIEDAIMTATQQFSNESVIEATSNRTGSPDIVDSLIEHIDEADLLVADLTPIYEFQKKDGIIKIS